MTLGKLKQICEENNIPDDVHLMSALMLWRLCSVFVQLQIFCRCNIFKYRFRADKKNGDEDIKKAEWYESKLMELNEKLKYNEV